MTPTLESTCVARTPTREEMEVLDNVAEHVLLRSQIFGQFERSDLKQELLIAGIEAYRKWNGGTGQKGQGKKLRTYVLQSMRWRVGRILGVQDYDCRKIYKYPMQSVDHLLEEQSSGDRDTAPRIGGMSSFIRTMSDEDRYAVIPEEMFDLDRDQKRILMFALKHPLSPDPSARGMSHRYVAYLLEMTQADFKAAWEKLVNNDRLREFLRSR